MSESLIITTLFDYGAWAWLIAAAVLLILEVFAPGVFLIWFGVAAAVVGVIALNWPMPILWQLAIFAGASIVSLYAARAVFRYGVEVSDPENLNVRGHQYVGRVVIVEDPIENGRGRARIGDTLWAVEGPDSPQGARVRVTGARGTVLTVESA
jgi:hypothetical protein